MAEKTKDRTFTVRYSDGTKALVKRVPPSRVADLISIQVQLLERLITLRAPANLLCDPETAGLMRTACEYLPVAGKDGQTLEFDRIDDWDELIETFFTTSTYIDPDTGYLAGDEEDQRYKPSRIAIHYGIDFFRLFAQAYQKARDALEREMKQQQPQPTSEPLPTPSSGTEPKAA